MFAGSMSSIHDRPMFLSKARICFCFAVLSAVHHSDAALLNLTGTTSFAATNLSNNTAFTANVPISTYTTINNSTATGAVVNGALIVPGGAGSGSGVYRRLFNLNNNGSVLDGYNREVPNKGEFESTVFSNPGPTIRISDLVAFQGHYVFALDVNEPSGGDVNRFISLDEIRLYVGTNTDPNPVPTTAAGLLPALGTKIWDLQANPIAGSRNDVLVDYSINNGSGTDDILLWVPTDKFAGFASDSFVYLYAKHGELGTTASQRGVQFSGFQTDGGGFDEWATYTATTTGTPPNTPLPLPEPSVTMLVALFLGTFLTRRSRPV